MLPQSSSLLMARPSSRGSHLTENGAARAAALPHADVQSTMRSSRLHDHLLRDHGRTEPELNGLPLADLHRFEHVEQAMGLNRLNHQHLVDVRPHIHVSAEPEETPITAVFRDAAGYRP